MGEVYRALDTRLQRTVAIKILPEQLSSDPVRKQRFEREGEDCLEPEPSAHLRTSRCW